MIKKGNIVMTYIWTEDSKGGFKLWNFINQYVLNNEAKVGQKQNVSELRKAACKLKPQSDDTYIIAMDNVFDNKTTMGNYDKVTNYIYENGYADNIVLLDTISTEYILLSYANLISNTEAQGKSLDKIVIQARQTV